MVEKRIDLVDRMVEMDCISKTLLDTPLGEITKPYTPSDGKKRRIGAFGVKTVESLRKREVVTLRQLLASDESIFASTGSCQRMSEPRRQDVIDSLNQLLMILEDSEADK